MVPDHTNKNNRKVSSEYYCLKKNQNNISLKVSPFLNVKIIAWSIFVHNLWEVLCVGESWWIIIVRIEENPKSNSIYVSRYIVKGCKHLNLYQDTANKDDHLQVQGYSQSEGMLQEISSAGTTACSPRHNCSSTMEHWYLENK